MSFFCDYRLKGQIVQDQRPIKWFAEKEVEYRKNFNSLGDCLSYLNEEYKKGKTYKFFSWIIFDFEKSSCYTGDFKIEEGSSFLELVNIKISNQFKQE